MLCNNILQNACSTTFPIYGYLDWTYENLYVLAVNKPSLLAVCKYCMMKVLTFLQKTPGLSQDQVVPKCKHNI